MKPGRASRTAVLVCMGRAFAHDEARGARFADPTAMALLPEDARRRVERARSGVPPTSLRERAERVYLAAQAKMMVARTLAIDAAVREAAAGQVVILGAGLDGRAWRMPELGEATVFEVDHPDSQRSKRARVEGLRLRAREVRFVAVDFAEDDLDAKLAQAGHDARRATTWIWEGVVMYLAPADVESTLGAIARRSAPASRLVIAYHAPAPLLPLIGLAVRRLGEPLRSSYTPDAMRALLARYGFRALRDDDMRALGAAVSPDIGRATRRMTHLRIVVADRSTAEPSTSA